MVVGDTINKNIVQINCKIIKEGSKKLEIFSDGGIKLCLALMETGHDVAPLKGDILVCQNNICQRAPYGLIAKYRTITEFTITGTSDRYCGVQLPSAQE